MNFKVTIDVQKIRSNLNTNDISDIKICYNYNDTVELKFNNKSDQIIPIANLSNDSSILEAVKDMKSQGIFIIKNSSDRMDLEFLNGNELTFKDAPKYYPSLFPN